MRALRPILVSALFLTTTGFPVDDGGDSGGGDTTNQAPVVTIESPVSGSDLYGGRVIGHAEDPDGLVTSVSVSVSGANGTEQKSVPLDANGRFDTSVYTYALGHDITIEVSAVDDEGAEGSDSVSAQQGCVKLTQPDHGSNDPTVWYGDFFACGYQSSAHWLIKDPDDDPDNDDLVPVYYTEVDQGPRSGWSWSRPDDGSVIVIKSYTGPSGEYFETLQRIRKHFVVQWSERPNNFDALRKGLDVKGLDVGGDVIIHFNKELTDVWGLTHLNVTASTPTSVQITHNPKLATCKAEAVITELRNRGWNGTALVEGNGSELTAEQNTSCN